MIDRIINVASSSQHIPIEKKNCCEEENIPSVCVCILTILYTEHIYCKNTRDKKHARCKRIVYKWTFDNFSVLESIEIAFLCECTGKFGFDGLWTYFFSISTIVFFLISQKSSSKAFQMWLLILSVIHCTNSFVCARKQMLLYEFAFWTRPFFTFFILFYFSLKNSSKLGRCITEKVEGKLIKLLPKKY